jgi:7,8-dihydropterin-6-yl-methyl-4-(beta-D-ribofuranosyl)aminobenzene 5'-phosphate synthase
MKRALSYSLCAVVFLLTLGAVRLPEKDPTLAITYLYDNTAAVPGVTADWGFSCLVECDGRRILFDTGANAGILRRNLSALKIDLSALDAVVISHGHDDHIGGIAALGARSGLPVFFPRHASRQAADAISAVSDARVPVTDNIEPFPGIIVSAEYPGIAWEDALALDTPEGLIVIVGCAHPGIVTMLRKIGESTGHRIDTVIGGFHLLNTPKDEVGRIIAEFKAMGIRRVGATHCTGDEAIRMFREAYGNGFIEGGVGTVVGARDAVHADVVEFKNVSPGRDRETQGPIRPGPTAGRNRSRRFLDYAAGFRLRQAAMSGT